VVGVKEADIDLVENMIDKEYPLFKSNHNTTEKESKWSRAILLMIQDSGLLARRG